MSINMARYISSCTYVQSLLIRLFSKHRSPFSLRLEVIFCVGFGQEFAYNSPESIAITSAWRKDVQVLSSFPGFVALTTLGTVPWLARIPFLSKDGVMKQTILHIGRKLVKQDKIDLDGKDIFSLLSKNWSLTTDQLLENVSVSHQGPWPLNCH